MKIKNKDKLIKDVETALEGNNPHKIVGSFTRLFLDMLEAQTTAYERIADALEKLTSTRN